MCSLTAYNVNAESLTLKDKPFILDLSQENKLLKECINFVMERQDKNSATGENNWINYDTGNKEVTVEYKFLPNDSITTIRGYQSMDDIINATDNIIKDYYSICDANYNDVFEWEKICDELCIEKFSVKQIDDNHNIVYSAHNSGVFGVSSRDFCYVKSRHLINDFTDNNGNTYDMVCSLCYSIDDYMDDNTGHVRGQLKNCGYIFMQNKNNGEITGCYVLHLDPGGWLPTYVINIVAPKKGMMVNKMHDNYDKIRDFLANRS